MKKRYQRTIIVGSLNGVEFDFSKLERKEVPSVKDILEDENESFEYLDESDDELNQPIKILKQTSLFDFDDGLPQQLVG